ncbi:DNA repair protein rad50, partial [Nowakowskiella sp. JEL0407]
PDETNVIEFQNPLTLIVGHNGSGKTTIIESLKYATTGDLPPNSKGGSFIHDPKVANTSEVKAQVKLRFKSISGKLLVATRSISATQKKQSLTQKTLDSTLSYTDPKTNKKFALSSKCSELDKEIPNHLGVCPAILENVIFCHQEDSHWPLSEPSVLKKKFDEIFAATRYTKALEAIKKLRKEKATNLKLETQRLSHLKSNKIKAEKIRVSYAKTTERIEQAESWIHDLDEKHISAVRSQQSNLNDLFAKYTKLESQLDAYKQEYTMKKEAIEELKKNLELYEESDEELNALLQEQTEKKAES